MDCACGARYEREVRTLPIKDIGAFECVDCGVRLEIWSGRKVPLFDEDLRLRVTNIDLAESGPPIPVGDASNGLPACEETWGSLALSPATFTANMEWVEGGELRTAPISAASAVTAGSNARTATASSGSAGPSAAPTR